MSVFLYSVEVLCEEKQDYKNEWSVTLITNIYIMSLAQKVIVLYMNMQEFKFTD